MEGKILSVRTRESKSALVIIEVDLGGKRNKYTVSEGTYRVIGCPLSGDIIDEAVLLTVSDEDTRRRALQRALNILSYADNNEITLAAKLRSAGFSAQSAKEAVEECVRLGYIDQRRQIERIISSSAASLLGPYKILGKLLSKRYPRELCFSILREMQDSGEINFNEMRSRLIEQRLNTDADDATKKKLLRRYGYIK